MVVPWATNLLCFHLNKVFKNVFCILELLGLAAVLAIFQKIGWFFLKLSGHPDLGWHETNRRIFRESGNLQGNIADVNTA